MINECSHKDITSMLYVINNAALNPKMVTKGNNNYVMNPIIIIYDLVLDNVGHVYLGPDVDLYNLSVSLLGFHI